MPEVRYTMLDKLKIMDKNANLIMAGSNTKTHGRVAKRGGVMTMTRGNWSGRIVKSGKEALGRWTYITLAGKKNRKVTIYTLYRVCDQKHNSGNCTIYMQQENDLRQKHKKIVDPRESILKDLTIQIQKDREQGHDIIVIGDTNDDVYSSKRIELFLYDNDMYNAIQEKHAENGPATYDRGSKCIDFVAVSNTIEKSAITKCGYLPFYQGIFSDHRAVYIDIKAEALFQRALPDTNRQIYKRFTTTQVTKCEKYLGMLDKYLEENNIYTKVDTLKKDMIKNLNTGEGDKDHLTTRSRILFEKTTQLMIASERNTGRKAYSNGYPSSKVLRDSADEVIKIKKKLRHERINQPSNIEKIGQLETELQTKKKQLKSKQSQADTLRSDDLDRLATKRAEQWNIKASQAIVVIKAAEESRKSHKKQRIFLKPKQGGSIRQVLVPTPTTNHIPKSNDIINEKIQCLVEDPKEIFNILLRQNYQHLTKSKESVFSSGKLHQALGDELENKIVDDILNGLHISDDIIAAHSEYGVTFENFIQSMTYATETTSGKTIRPYEWSFGPEEYKATFGKTKETTACGPSGIHMSHWKAALENTKIMEVHSFFIWSAFQFGHSYQRWDVSWHCMIQKKSSFFAKNENNTTF